MKQLATSYSFNTVAKTVTLTGLDVPLNHVLLIINATRNQIIYNLAEPALGAQSYQQGASSVITLKADLAGAANTDQLTIFYDNGAESQIVLVQGPVGPAGDTGDTGPKGDTGDTGLKGDTGDTGLKGDTGDTGLKGDTGDVGLKGDTGDVGPKGDTGDKGDPGDTGPAGIDGQDGAVGPKGDTGDTGPKGDTGDVGQDALWNFKGEYDNGGLYAVGDIVSYLGGSYYRLLPPNAGYPPSNATYWNVVASKGDTGTAGTTTWSGITDKPTEFAPTAHKSTHFTDGSDALTPEDIGATAIGHTHAIADTTDLQTALDGKVNNYLQYDVALAATELRSIENGTTLGLRYDSEFETSEEGQGGGGDSPWTIASPTSFRNAIGAIPATEKAAANGVATLGADSKVPTSQLPAPLVLDVNGKTGEVQLTAADLNVFETQAQGPADEWTPSDATEVAGRANTAYNSANSVGADVQNIHSNHISNFDNPHGVTAAQIGAEPTITTLPVSRGGTGSTTAANALTALGAVASVPADASYVKTIRTLTSTEYDALESIDPNTIYFII